MARLGRPAKEEVLDKVKICIPPALHKKLVELAENEKRSFSSMCCLALDEWLKAREAMHRSGK